MKLVPWTTLVSFSGFCKIQCNDYWYSRKGLNQYSWNTDSIKTLMNLYYHVGVQHFLMNICLHLRDAEFLDVPCVVHSNWWVGIQKHVCYRRFRTTCWRLGEIVVLELFLNREKAGRYCNIVLCLDIIYIYILTYTNRSSIFGRLCWGSLPKTGTSSIEKNLGTWNWGEARLSKIEADLQQSLKATGGRWKPSKTSTGVGPKLEVKWNKPGAKSSSMFAC